MQRESLVGVCTRDQSREGCIIISTEAGGLSFSPCFSRPLLVLLCPFFQQFFHGPSKPDPPSPSLPRGTINLKGVGETR